MSNANNLIGNTIIRREKVDTPKVYQILETSIVIDKNKALHNEDRGHINGHTIPGMYIYVFNR